MLFHGRYHLCSDYVIDLQEKMGEEKRNQKLDSMPGKQEKVENTAWSPDSSNGNLEKANSEREGEGDLPAQSCCLGPRRVR